MDYDEDALEMLSEMYSIARDKGLELSNFNPVSLYVDEYKKHPSYATLKDGYYEKMQEKIDKVLTCVNSKLEELIICE
jgi:hypothetical protein